MDVLSISSPILCAKHTSRCPLSKPLRQSSKTQILFTPASRSLSLKSSLNPPRRATKALGYSFEVAATDTREDPRSPSGDSIGFLLNERIVFIAGEINDFVADAIVSQLLLLDAQDPTKDIRLFINSYGGPVSATMAIYDVLQLVRADVSTIGLGIVASTASILLGGGTKGKRLAMPNSRIMLHQPYGGASGQAFDVAVQAREVLSNKNNCIRIISDFTGRPFDEIEEFIDIDQYMSAVEATEYGIIDGVIDRERVLPLDPVPEKVVATLSYGRSMMPDIEKFFSPDIPDDEIY